jgi:hypothetical protein
MFRPRIFLHQFGHNLAACVLAAPREEELPQLPVEEWQLISPLSYEDERSAALTCRMLRNAKRLQDTAVRDWSQGHDPGWLGRPGLWFPGDLEPWTGCDFD